jgi:hypothetical protein
VINIANIGRVIGHVSGRENNFAWDGMTITANGVPKFSVGNAHDHNDGANLSAITVMTSKATWEAAGFDFSATGSWVWDNTGVNMPSLRNSTPQPWPAYLIDTSALFTDVNDIATFLASQTGGITANNPIPLTVDISLGDMTDTNSNWWQLLEAINAANKFVALDLSASPMTAGTVFDSVDTPGRYRIVSIILPSATTAIGESAFFNCTGLTSITIGDSVTDIGGWAFAECTGLTSITIPDSVTTIGIGAFAGCTGLTEIIIPDSVTDIGDWAFLGCTALTSITIGNSVTSIGAYAFVECTGLTSITIPDSVTSIGGYAFEGCTGLTSITLPMTGVSFPSLFGDDASAVPSSLKTVIINGGTSIPHYAFQNCAGLTSITIPNSVIIIEEGAFWQCTSLTSVDIPGSVTTIGDAAFGGCTGLTSVTIGNGVITISREAFISCTSLTNIVIPDSVTSIGNDAFFGCTGLTSVTIGNGVISIGAAAFSRCSSLTSIVIPDSVTSIGENAFSDCTNLTSIIMERVSPPTLGSSVFEGTHATLRIIVPVGSAAEYRAAANWSADNVRNRIHSVGCALDNPAPTVQCSCS